jgi:hypothetical protein
MTFRALPRVLATVLLATSVVWAAGCNDDEDDECMNCCECYNDPGDIKYRPEAPGNCMTCTEQCQALADRDFMGQKFDVVREIGCPD